MLKILYQSEVFVAVEKPAGLLVHPSFLTKRDEPSALKLLRDQLGQWVYPVHRLDRPTSGALVFALSSESAQSLALQFSSQQIEKTYYAIVRGWLPEGRQKIDKPLRKLEGAEDLQECQTFYECLASYELPFATSPEHPTSRYSLVRVQPKTGRWHQIRRHFAWISHPLIGDVVYGTGRQNRLFREQLGLHRLLLHCGEMKFDDVLITSPLPAEFTERLLQYRVESPLKH
jgi:tRNA pseudouridine65 synthase